MNYLIVDDHPRTREAVIEALRQPSDVFVEAGTGEEAVELYEAGRPDWVIMDVKMPGRGGLAATSQIVARHADARIVVISQYDDQQMAEQARESGAREFVTKDRIAELGAIIEGLSGGEACDRPIS